MRDICVAPTLARDLAPLRVNAVSAGGNRFVTGIVLDVDGGLHLT